MDKRDSATKMAAQLKSLGIAPGDTILVHSSFKALGLVPGGIETVIQGLLQAIESDGTLLIPALSWALRPPEAFNVRTTPTNIGAISEYFRTREGTFRSVHPTHSVCAVGKRTHEMLDEHHLDSTPCGPHSPFSKLTQTDAKIVMLGCGLTPSTTMHALEEQAGAPYVFGPSYAFTLTDWSGATYEKEYKTHGFSVHGYAQRYDRLMELGTGSFLRKGKVLEADTFILKTRELREAVLKKMSENPLFFVDKVKAAP